MPKSVSREINRFVVAAVCDRRLETNPDAHRAPLQKNLPAVTDSRYSPPKNLRALYVALWLIQ